MKLYDKILIAINAILTIIYCFIVLAKGNFSADSFGQLIGAIAVAFLIPYFIAFIASKLTKSDNKKLLLWKIFIKIYPIILVITIIGSIKQ